jgi:predicted aspartyl protease
MLLCALGLSNRAFCQSNDSNQTPCAESQPTTREVPIRVYRGYLAVVEGAIGNLQNLKFLIDTGSSPTIIDERRAKAIGVVEAPARLALATRTVLAKQATVPAICVGTLRANSVPVLIQDLSGLSRSLGSQIDGVIGLDVLSQSSFTINYKSRRLRFGPVQDSAAAISFETGPPLVTVTVLLEDRRLRLLIDTGASALMLFHSRVGALAVTQNIEVASAANMGGQFRRIKVLFKDAQLGKTKLGPQIGFIVDDQQDGGRDFDGVLSLAALRFQEIGFDFERRRLMWKP